MKRSMALVEVVLITSSVLYYSYLLKLAASSLLFMPHSATLLHMIGIKCTMGLLLRILFSCMCSLFLHILSYSLFMVIADCDRFRALELHLNFVYHGRELEP